jgi:hypothetical protein
MRYLIFLKLFEPLAGTRHLLVKGASVASSIDPKGLTLFPIGVTVRVKGPVLVLVTLTIISDSST